MSLRTIQRQIKVDDCRIENNRAKVLQLNHLSSFAATYMGLFGLIRIH